MFMDYNGVMNPKIQIIHPKFVFNHLVEDQDSQYGYHQEIYGENKQYNQNCQNNQNNQNIQNNNMKNGWFDALVNNKNNQIQNTNKQQSANSSQRLYTGIQLRKQAINSIPPHLQKLPYNHHLQPIPPKNSLVQYVADNIQFSALDPLKNKMNYGYSPYNSKQLEAFKSLGTDMVRQKRMSVMKVNGEENKNVDQKYYGLGY